MRRLYNQFLRCLVVGILILTARPAQAFDDIHAASIQWPSQNALFSKSALAIQPTSRFDETDNQSGRLIVSDLLRQEVHKDTPWTPLDRDVLAALERLRLKRTGKKLRLPKIAEEAHVDLPWLNRRRRKFKPLADAVDAFLSESRDQPQRQASVRSIADEITAEASPTPAPVGITPPLESDPSIEIKQPWGAGDPFAWLIHGPHDLETLRRIFSFNLKIPEYILKVHAMSQERGPINGWDEFVQRLNGIAGSRNSQHILKRIRSRLNIKSTGPARQSADLNFDDETLRHLDQVSRALDPFARMTRAHYQRIYNLTQGVAEEQLNALLAKKLLRLGNSGNYFFHLSPVGETALQQFRARSPRDSGGSEKLKTSA